VRFFEGLPLQDQRYPMREQGLALSVSVAFIGNTLLGGEGYHTSGRHYRILCTLSHEYPGLVHENATRHRSGTMRTSENSSRDCLESPNRPRFGV
jgi:hypothetical protein